MFSKRNSTVSRITLAGAAGVTTSPESNKQLDRAANIISDPHTVGKHYSGDVLAVNGAFFAT